ncbi:Alpha/beta hydrolase fold-3 domain protein [Solidesulfovibrio fructosivorans JJ]]|uniref:Alpha/beta hydrolase fold-3 domain protein n=1 Tax=Solidesulfovibrio fructosivorans JJ] TaxID=596151 RepID=E1JZ56_SOLFR|nr:alpha/beta hydrolase [Solidesulfovibrio fructosivorans]EFL50339.1 Alpha/beta hydrolase fold-3 domain protein [Solidesulfovibrio fructosivorans JJ]]
MSGRGKEVDAYLQQIFKTRKGVDTDRIRRKWLDIPYASLSPAQKLDIYLPETGDGPFPVVIAIHGGSFTAGDKRDFQVAPMLAALDRGYAVVPINYRLTGEALFPAQIGDVKAAIRWVRANAAKYSLRPDRIALWGDSAGGNLAALAGVTGGTGELEDKSLGNGGQSSKVAAVVDWYGPIDFLTMGDPQRLAEKGNKLIGKTTLEAPQLYREASPESHIHPGIPPILIQHGDADRVISVSQSIHFADALRKGAGEGSVVIDILKGADHLDERFTTPENTARVLDFLDKYMK